MLYTLSAQVFDNEYLITTPLYQLFTFRNLDKAKEFFSHIYEAITNNAPDTEPFRDASRTLALTQPSVLALNIPLDQLAAEILAWSNNQPLQPSPAPIIEIPHTLMPMKPGFIDNYLALHIRKDIETTAYIAANGEITYHRFNLIAKGK